MHTRGHTLRDAVVSSATTQHAAFAQSSRIRQPSPSSLDPTRPYRYSQIAKATSLVSTLDSTTYLPLPRRDSVVRISPRVRATGTRNFSNISQSRLSNVILSPPGGSLRSRFWSSCCYRSAIALADSSKDHPSDYPSAAGLCHQLDGEVLEKGGDDAQLKSHEDNSPQERALRARRPFQREIREERPESHSKTEPILRLAEKSVELGGLTLRQRKAAQVRKNKVHRRNRAHEYRSLSGRDFPFETLFTLAKGTSPATDSDQSFDKSMGFANEEDMTIDLSDSTRPESADLVAAVNSHRDSASKDDSVVLDTAFDWTAGKILSPRIIHSVVVEQLLHQRSIRDPEPFVFIVDYLLRTGHARLAADLTRRLLVMLPDTAAPALEKWMAYSSQHGDVGAMVNLVRRLSHLDVQPQISVWRWILKVAPSVQEKHRVLREIHRRGYVENKTFLDGVLREIIPWSLQMHIANGGQLASYLEALTKLYGFVWLGKPSIRRIINSLGSNGKFYDAVIFLWKLQSSCRMHPDAMQLNILLSHTLSRRDWGLRMALLSLFLRQFRVTPDAVTFSRIFHAAWRDQLYNTCRVIWIYAASESQIHRTMKSMVHASLIAARTKSAPRYASKNTRGARWFMTIGSFIFRQNPEVALLSGPATQSTPTGSTEIITENQSRQEKATHTFIDFYRDLRRAVEMDREWARSGKRQEANLSWMLENAIELPYRPEKGVATG